jgi:predicted amidohydrolase
MHVALVQLCSGRDVDANLATCRRLGEAALERDPDWLLYPENAPFLGRDDEKPQVAEPLDGSMVEHFRSIAREGDVWVTLGSFPEQIEGDDRSYNTQVTIAPDGSTAAVYRKIHLFDVDVEGGRSYRESNSVRGGEAIVDVEIEAAGTTTDVGPTICYDLRFPELYRRLARRGVEVATVPSAFTRQTGRDHWHPLLRARAIENQMYVLAPNQWGSHFGDRASYGHSAVYDPWGQRIACASDGERVVHAELDFEYLASVRRDMPCLEHARLDDISTASDPPSDDSG